MTPDALRKAWVTFFEERQHAHLPSASLVPEDDPTLLFTGAGMNQFKDMFVGKGNLPHHRVVTVQKCFRQGDLELVGRTPRHLTFFEMLGHFSFGDYFKKEAIGWAWEFLLDVLNLPEEKLRVTVYEDDDEAEQVWRDLGVAADRILRCDASENFWPADAPTKGPNGPCGPCSEIFYDYGPAYEVGDGGPKVYDSGRYVEIWNTVFTQYDRRDGGELIELPQKNIDCGAGFERILAALEGEISPFGTQLFRPTVERVAALAERTYAWDPDGGQTPGEDPRRMRRIAEHARAACFMVADGVKPSNEGRGYVLRRVLRRAIRDGIQLGLREPFLAELVDPVLAAMGEAYPAVGEGREVLRAVLQGEDVRFRETYATGLRYLEEEVAALGSERTLPGAVAFKLYDTYGFPLDLAQVILAERDIAVDEAGFDEAMTAQRERARAGSKIKTDIFAGGPLTELKSRGVQPTEFVGYDGAGCDAQGAVVAIIGGASGDLVPTAGEGESVTVVADRTPFYAESGGQVGDRGVIESDAVRLEVDDTQASQGYTLHTARLVRGTLKEGDGVRLCVDAAARDAIRRNHTATHLMHLALKQILGEHVQQEGSLVAPDRLRFDFRHPQAVTPAEITAIEELVNDWILRNDEVQTDVMDLAAAKASGAVSLFGEKYGDVVRVLSIPSGSKELCGGTHCRRTGDIGSFRITLEASIAAGIRRVEAVTGPDATGAAARDRGVVQGLGSLLKASPDELVDRVRQLQDELKGMRKAAEKARLEAGRKGVERLAGDAAEVGGFRIVVAPVPGADPKSLKGASKTLAAQGVDVMALVGDAGGGAPLYVGVDKRAVEAGVSAKDLIGVLTGVLGGGGGGSPTAAQGKGQDASRIEDALEQVRAAIADALG